jgi:two-component system KDP operon response regulator KdpE
VALLDAGADDYVTKPFSTTEFQARVRAQLRRLRLTPLAPTDAVIRVGDLAIDLGAPAVTRDGAPVHLTRTEWDLLRTLLRHAGRTLTHKQIFDEVWGRSAGDAQQYVRVYVANLRRKLESDPLRPALIVTEPGMGYRLIRPALA